MSGGYLLLLNYSLFKTVCQVHIFYSYTLAFYPELKTLEWWISKSMLDLLFFLISRLNNACSPLVINLQLN